MAAKYASSTARRRSGSRRSPKAAIGSTARAGVSERMRWRYPARVSNSKVDALSQVPLFADSSRADLEFLATRTDEVDVEAGRTLIRQGHPSDSFFLLLDGEADVEVDGRARPPLGAGRFFGEISMLDRGPATATVVTKTPVRLMVMSHAQFRDAVKANDQLLSHVLSAAADRLRRDYMERHPT